mmetsp:Transcript_59857/g.160424  ORF Transcript_59857/g.160424 Transcript_59857/m.160424 type:complete len:102 (+) Transcript_59857:242-547(+)
MLQVPASTTSSSRIRWCARIDGKVAVSHTTNEAFRGMPAWRFNSHCSVAHDHSQCQICLDDYADGDELRTLPCNHVFHKQCVDQWLQLKSNSCPTCRLLIE